MGFFMLFILFFGILLHIARSKTPYFFDKETSKDTKNDWRNKKNRLQL